MAVIPRRFPAALCLAAGLLAPSPALPAQPCPGLPPTADAAALVRAANAKLAARPPGQHDQSGQPDPAAAHEAALCLEAAFAAGDPGAAAVRAEIARAGLDGPADPTLAAHWFLLAARAGSPQGHLGLGQALANGQGLPADPYWAYWRLRHALLLPGLSPREATLAKQTAATVAARLSPAARAAIEANLSGKATP